MTIEESGTHTLGDRPVRRLGYDAMQLAGKGVFGPPKDPEAARAVLREAVGSGVNRLKGGAAGTPRGKMRPRA